VSDQIYHGYARGGPLDGQVITHDVPYYEALEWPTETKRYTPEDFAKPIDPNVTIKRVVYRHNGAAWVLQ
jgi:hypothetical protein